MIPLHSSLHLATFEISCNCLFYFQATCMPHRYLRLYKSMPIGHPYYCPLKYIPLVVLFNIC